jgi:hypothetical protein
MDFPGSFDGIVRIMTTETLIRIDTQEASYFYEAETEEAALYKFANTIGYDTYAELASTIGKSVDEAKADLTIRTVTLHNALTDIIDEALESNAKDDGATDRFELASDWADWCWEGKTGDDARRFAREHNISLDGIYNAVRDALCARDVDDINAAFDDGSKCGERSGVLFADVDGKEPLVSGDVLPEQFFHHFGADVYRYTYTGPHSYDVFERRDEGDRVIWIGCGSEHITDDTTAEDLEATLG